MLHPLEQPVIVPEPPPRKFYLPSGEDNEDLEFRTDIFKLAGIQDNTAHYDYDGSAPL